MLKIRAFRVIVLGQRQFFLKVFWRSRQVLAGVGRRSGVSGLRVLSHHWFVVFCLFAHEGLSSTWASNGYKVSVLRCFEAAHVRCQ